LWASVDPTTTARVKSGKLKKAIERITAGETWIYCPEFSSPFSKLAFWCSFVRQRNQNKCDHHHSPLMRGRGLSSG
jgi:hypothetical protein